MACAVPVISTSGGALPEVVGDAGLLIPPASADALAAAIVQLLEDPDRARQLGAAGYRRVMNEFTWSRAAQKTIKAYRTVIGDYG
jgi:glycosyltransferase involved in cell wall biosynthesis